jgi:hypothetical protein
MMTVVKGTIVDYVTVGAVPVPEGDRPDLHVVRKAWPRINVRDLKLTRACWSLDLNWDRDAHRRPASGGTRDLHPAAERLNAVAQAGESGPFG